MPQIFDVIANGNARYKRNELELNIAVNRCSSPQILHNEVFTG